MITSYFSFLRRSTSTLERMDAMNVIARRRVPPWLRLLGLLLLLLIFLAGILSLPRIRMDGHSYAPQVRDSEG
jgi:type VI protein secretion system component VasF